MWVGQPYFFFVAQDDNKIVDKRTTPNNFATLFLIIFMIFKLLTSKVGKLCNNYQHPILFAKHLHPLFF
jgi:hypothetical protein